MKCLAWNCCGLGNPYTVCSLLRIIRREGPGVVFLSETILKGNKVDSLKRRCNFYFVFSVDAEGRSGGLILMWKADVEVTLRNYSKNHVNAIVKERHGASWRFTGFYGEPSTSMRHRSWSLLNKLGENNMEPWVVMGDFNEILWNREKKGRQLRPERQMEAFRNALKANSLIDLGYHGPRFTWKRGKTARTLVQERLDRVVASLTWMNTFPFYKVSIHALSKSDHCPITLNTEGNKITLQQPTRRQRKFTEVAWLKEEDAPKLIEESWKFGGLNLVEKIETTQDKLHQWTSVKIKGAKVRIDKLHDKLAKCKDRIETEDDIQLEEGLSAEIDDLLLKEESYWQQRARINWLRHGDRNTNFFHSQAS